MKHWTAALILAVGAAIGGSKENKLPADASAALQHGSSFCFAFSLPELLPGGDPPQFRAIGPSEHHWKA
jgi:hypothetical protein